MNEEIKGQDGSENENQILNDVDRLINDLLKFDQITDENLQTYREKLSPKEQKIFDGYTIGDKKIYASLYKLTPEELLEVCKIYFCSENKFGVHFLASPLQALIKVIAEDPKYKILMEYIAAEQEKNEKKWLELNK